MSKRDIFDSPALNELPVNASQNSSNISGVTPFLSAEVLTLPSDVEISSHYHSCCRCGSSQNEDTSGSNSSCVTSPVSRRANSRCCVLTLPRKRKLQASPSPGSRKAYIRTGLTGEMEILRVDSASPPKGVTFSTPVSVEKLKSKNKVTRFKIPVKTVVDAEDSQKGKR